MANVDMSLRGINFPASRLLRDNEQNAVINALDKNGDKVLQRNELLITSQAKFNRMDTNYNGRLEANEAKAAMQRDELTITFPGARQAAVDVLLKMDSNQDGYLGKNELELNQKMANQVDGYGSRKYSYKNGALARDQKGKIRETGIAQQDGRISISEMANAIADQLINIGSRFTIPGRD